MKKFYLVAVAALSLASCSNDDVMSLKQDEIKFNVVAENPSRAADVYCNNNMPVDFNMWAYWTNTAGNAIWYIDEALVEKGADGYAPVNTIYWPEDTYSLNFIALKNFPDGLYIDGNGIYYGTGGIRYWISAEEDVTKQVDMLYAVTPNQKKSVNAADGVKLNFRHALSQIVFNGKKTNSNLHIEVKGVMAGNVGNQANISSFPESTLSGYVNHTGDVTDESLDCISWYLVGYNEGQYHNFSVELAEPVVLGAESTALTSANADGKEFSSTAMLLIPQTREAWDPSTTPKVAEEGAKTYLAVNCTIWNVAGDAFNATTDVKLHEGWAYIPVAYDWKPGKKYTYTFVFGNGNGGYDEDGNEVLSPMTYTVTVDDFQAVENINPEMNID